MGTDPAGILLLGCIFMNQERCWCIKMPQMKEKKTFQNIMFANVCA